MKLKSSSAVRDDVSLYACRAHRIHVSGVRLFQLTPLDGDSAVGRVDTQVCAAGAEIQ
jgi:hypothetical protein